jgi:site-specific recombinase XerD
LVLAKCHIPRERLMLLVLWETGCRNDTLCNLRWENLFDDDTVFLKGKRGHERYVSVDRSIFDELQTFKEDFGDLNLKKEFIWVNPDT